MNKNLNKIFCILALCAVATQSAFTMEEQENSKTSKGGRISDVKSDKSGGSGITSNSTRSTFKVSDDFLNSIVSPDKLKDSMSHFDSLKELAINIINQKQVVLYGTFCDSMHDFLRSLCVGQNSHGKSCLINKENRISSYRNNEAMMKLFVRYCDLSKVVITNQAFFPKDSKAGQVWNTVTNCFFGFFQECNKEPKFQVGTDEKIKNYVKYIEKIIREKKLTCFDDLDASNESLKSEYGVDDFSLSQSQYGVDSFNLSAKSDFSGSSKKSGLNINDRSFARKKQLNNQPLDNIEEQKNENGGSSQNTPAKNQKSNSKKGDEETLIQQNVVEKNNSLELIKPIPNYNTEKQITSEFDGQSQQVETQNQIIIDEQKKPDDQVNETRTDVVEETKIDQKKPVVQGLDDKSKTASEVIILPKNQENGNEVTKMSSYSYSNELLTEQVETQNQIIIDEQKKPDDQVNETRTDVVEGTKIDEKEPVVQVLDDKSKATSEVIMLQKKQENDNKVTQDSNVAVSNNYVVPNELLKNKKSDIGINKLRGDKDQKVAEDKACINSCNIF